MKKDPAAGVIQRTFLVLTAFSLAACLVGCSSLPGFGSQPFGRSGCMIQIQGQITQGEHAGLELAGTVKLPSVEDGSFNAELEQHDGSKLSLDGEIHGRAISFVASSSNAFPPVFGGGTLQSSVQDCRGSGGGYLAGPGLDDQGGWQATMTPSEGMAAGTQILLACVLILAIATAGLVVGVKFQNRILRWFGKPGSYRQGGPAVSSRGPLDILEEPQSWPGQEELPFAQFLTTYQYGDNRYDSSFSLELNGEYLGECGASIMPALAAGSPKKVTGLEVWAFDKSNIRTMIRILVSEAVFHNPAQQALAAEKGELVLIRPELEIEMETHSLIVRGKVLHIEYMNGPDKPNTYFRRVTLRLAAWKQPSTRPG